MTSRRKSRLRIPSCCAWATSRRCPAGGAGLPVSIYRPLDIVGSVRTGAWNTSTEMAALIRFIADTGLAPDIDLPLDFVAADTCAWMIAELRTAGVI